jgi:CRISPR-associated protein Cas2
MYIVVAYDIVDDKRRTRLAKTLIDFGFRVQKSVFECQLDDRLYLKMRTIIEKIIDHEVDSVRYYFLCKNCANNIKVSGLGSIYNSDEDDVIII